MKCVRNAENGVVWVVRGHPRSSAMPPFDRVHMISYSSLIESMHLSCTIFEIQRVICGNLPTFYPTCIWCPRWGWPCSNFKKIFGVRKLESLGYHLALFVLCLTILIQGSYRPWKVLEFYCSAFQVWNVLEKGIGVGKPWKSPGILKQMSWNFEFLVCLCNSRRCSLAPLECKKTVKRQGLCPGPRCNFL